MISTEFPDFNRDDKGPGRRTGIDVCKVEGNHRVRAVICSREIAGYWTHWDSLLKCTVPCTVKPNLCPHCLQNKPRRWCAWLHVAKTSGNPGVWIELTASARDNLIDCLPENFILRGSKILCLRQKGHTKSPLVFEYLGYVEDDFKIPLPADPENILRRLYRKHDYTGPDDVRQVG